jgi:FKBP-type peptidyl-prolyl cis-trans isomerase
MRVTPIAVLFGALLIAATGCQQTSTTSSGTSGSSSAATAQSTGTTAAAGDTGSAAQAGGTSDRMQTDKTMDVSLPDGSHATLRYSDLKVGDGSIAGAGMTADVNYTGWLTDGTKFDSSLDRGQTFPVRIGAVPPQVILGWDQGLRGMRVGGKRRLVIPPELAYGERGAGGVIPPNATLVFEVELVGLH